MTTSTIDRVDFDHPVGGWLDRNAKFVFLAPTVGYILLLGVFPLIFSLFMVFGKWKRGDITWVGSKNLERMVHEDRFWNSLKLTIIFVVLVTVIELVIGILVALSLQSMTRGKTSLRLLYTLPMMLAPIAVAFSWRMMFEFARGPLNYLLSEVGITPVKWLGDSRWAFASLALVDIWQWTPFIALGALAALESQPVDLYEAAVVDGAHWHQLIMNLALPLLAPYLIVLAVLRAIDAFKIVDPIFILTGGGPGTATEFLTFYGYVAGFRPFNLGYTAAVAWSLVVIMTVFFMIFLRVARGNEEIG